jgi:hypothetical protein
MQTFKPPKPDGTKKTYKFNLNKFPSVFKIRLNLKDVDPDARSGPLVLYVNDVQVLYLNKYFPDISPTEEHEASWRLVEIDEIPLGYLKTGENSITIAVLETVLYGFDDVNFYGLSVGYK